MTIRERLTFVGERAKIHFQIEDTLPRANVASNRNVTQLKQFLHKLKESYESKHVSLDFEAFINSKDGYYPK